MSKGDCRQNNECSSAHPKAQTASSSRRLEYNASQQPHRACSACHHPNSSNGHASCYGQGLPPTEACSHEAQRASPLLMSGQTWSARQQPIRAAILAHWPPGLHQSGRVVAQQEGSVPVCPSACGQGGAQANPVSGRYSRLHVEPHDQASNSGAVLYSAT